MELNKLKEKRNYMFPMCTKADTMQIVYFRVGVGARYIGKQEKENDDTQRE